MVDRQRRRAPAASALSGRCPGACAALLALVVLAVGGACGEARSADADGRDRPAGAGGHGPAAPLTRAASSDPRRGTWSPRMEAILADWVARGVRHTGGRARPADFEISVHVVELATGLELGSRLADVPRIPASNMKLVTTAAALVLLGPGQDFLTPAEGTGPVEGGVLRGDLVLRAAGDPVVGEAEDARVEWRLDAIAQRLLDRGVRRIAGDVVLDEGSFAEPGPAPGWPDPAQYWQEHCALAGGFSINGGVLQARILARKGAGPAHVEVHPAPHGLRSSIGVASEGKRLDVRVGATATTVTVRGSIPRGQPLYLASFAHPDPVGLFGAVLMERLRFHGVAVEGVLRRERGVPPGTHLAELRSPLEGTLVPINTYSRNSVADQLFLAVGHALVGVGSLEAGEAASRLALERLGVPLEGFRQADGSGLSRENRVSARQLTELIAGIGRAGRPTWEAFRDSLATSGQPGTLEDRMSEGPAAGRVWAKNGWIGGASSLSGICETTDGRELVFSILVEYPARLGGLNRACFKPMQDALVTDLVVGAP